LAATKPARLSAAKVSGELRMRVIAGLPCQ
jgi:hypothetical protein